MIDKLYREYYTKLLRFCISLSGSRAPAEDLVQDTFLRAMGHLDTLERLSEVQCRSWLYKTAKNIFIDKYRRKAKEPRQEENVYTEDDLSEIMVRQLCNFLPGEERTLFWMRYMEGYNATELGKIFDMPSGTVRARLSSARKKMAILYLEKQDI